MSAAPGLALEPAASRGFAQTWTAEILSAPPLIAPARQFTYPRSVPGEEDTLARGALLLQVRPAAGGTFLATCALGFSDPRLSRDVFACPRADHLLALAGGYAYLVDTLVPEHSLHVPLKPVTAVLPAVSAGLLLLVGFHHIVALDAGGLRWTSARLSWEGVTLGEVRDGRLHGLGWDLHTDRELPFSVDLRTGEHEGGGFLL